MDLSITNVHLDLGALERGLPNLQHHIENVRQFRAIQTANVELATRLARELHDETCQTISALNMRLETAVARLPAGADNAPLVEARMSIREIADHVGVSYTTVRHWLKRYDLATMGRRRAHASYHQSHGTDVSTALTFAMDLTPLVEQPSCDPAAFVQERLDAFRADVLQRMARVG